MSSKARNWTCDLALPNTGVNVRLPYYNGPHYHQPLLIMCFDVKYKSKRFTNILLHELPRFILPTAPLMQIFVCIVLLWACQPPLIPVTMRLYSCYENKQQYYLLSNDKQDSKQTDWWLSLIIDIFILLFKSIVEELTVVPGFDGILCARVVHYPTWFPSYFISPRTRCTQQVLLLEHFSLLFWFIPPAWSYTWRRFTSIHLVN